MNSEINLLPGKAKQSSASYRKRLLLQRISIALLFIISFLSITLFILIALSPLPSLQQREKDERNRMSFFNEFIVKLRMTKHKLNDIDSLLKSRPVYASTIESLNEFLTEDAAISEVHLNDKVLSVSVTSISLLPLDSFLEKLPGYVKENKKIKKVYLESIKTDFEKGIYVMTVELQLI